MGRIGMALVVLVALAGCIDLVRPGTSGQDDAGEKQWTICGHANEECCSRGRSCEGDLECMAGTCIKPDCGGKDQMCCAGNKCNHFWLHCKKKTATEEAAGTCR
jgi:hypothetical protein